MILRYIIINDIPFLSHCTSLVIEIGIFSFIIASLVKAYIPFIDVVALIIGGIC